MTQIAHISYAFFRKSTLREFIAKSSLVSLLLPFLLFFVGGQIATAPSAEASCVTSYPTTGWKAIRSGSGAIPTDMFGNSSTDFQPYKNTGDIVGTTGRNPVEWFTSGSSCDFFFRMRVVTKPTNNAGQLDNMIWLVAIGNSTSGTLAWTGVNGGGNGSDTRVYVNNPSNGTTRYVDTVAKTVDLDSITNRNVSVISAGSASDYWVQWRVPYSEFSAAGANITGAPMGLWAGTSQSNSLSSINADCLDSFRRGGVVTGDCTTPDYSIVSLASLSVPLSTVVADPAFSTVTANATLRANGTDTATVTVTLRSSAGAQLTSSGGTVTLALASPNPSGVTGTLGTVTDNLDGTYTARFTAGRIAGTVNVVARLDGVLITGTPSAAVITLTVSNDPYATTNEATGVTSSQATLSAAFVKGSPSTVNTFIEYCQSAANTCTSSAITSGTTTITVGALTTTSSETSTVVVGLSAGATYFFRAYITDGANRYDGEIKSFIAGAPVATTTAATAVTGTTAVLNGNVNASGGSANITFCLSAASTVNGSGALGSCLNGTTTPSPSSASGSSNTNSSSTASGLTPDRTYFFQIIGTTGGLVTYGSVLNFITSAHSATTNAATSVTQTAATLNGTIGTAGGQSVTTAFYWSTTADFSSDTNTVSVSPVTTDPSGSTSTPLTGLTAATTYYFYVTGTLGGVTRTGAILSFTTSSVPAPSPTPTPVVIPPVTITWPTPAGIKYPAPLGSTQLNATAMCNGVAVTGTYTYLPALGAILAPGTHTLTVTFNPTSGNCQGSSTTVQIVVSAPNAPTITWPNPAPVAGPHTLSPAQLNATCSVPGTLTYDPALGTVLQPGSYTIKVTCTPTDRNYPPVSTTVPLVVEKVATKITWADPTPIIIGTPLSNTQLNALFSVPGTCVYIPALTTVLPVGVHTLSVTCTPTNGALYSPATTTVKIEVLPISKSTIAPIVISGNSPTIVSVPKELQGSRSQVVTVGPGLISASISGARISKTPDPGFSGSTYITISSVVNSKTTVTTIPVNILVAAAPSKSIPITFTQGRIWWTKSPNAVSYEVTVWGESVCSTTELSCTVERTIGPKTQVRVIAKGNDGLTATSRAVYENRRPLIATAVYFDTAKFVIKPEGSTEIRRVAAIIKKEGFTRLIIEGHTDTQTGIDNQVLSNNRSRATASAFRKLLPAISTRLSGSAFKKPAAPNDTPEGMALNRRSEVLVW